MILQIYITGFRSYFKGVPTAPPFCGEGCLSVIKPTARGAWCSQNSLEIGPETIYVYIARSDPDNFFRKR